MNKKNFTLDDVEQMIEDLGFKWNERNVFNPNEEKYRKLKHNSFSLKKPLFLSIETIKGDLILALAEIDNETFILNFNGAKANASEQWKKLLSQKEQEMVNGCKHN